MYRVSLPLYFYYKIFLFIFYSALRPSIAKNWKNNTHPQPTFASIRRTPHRIHFNLKFVNKSLWNSTSGSRWVLISYRRPCNTWIPPTKTIFSLSLALEKVWHTFFDKLRLIFAGSRRNISKPFPIHNLLQVDLSQNIHLVNDRCHVRRFLGINLVHCTWPALRLHWPSRSIYFRWRNAKSKWSRCFY